MEGGVESMALLDLQGMQAPGGKGGGGGSNLSVALCEGRHSHLSVALCQ
jgi:Lanthionine-containing peptide SapB precursor RamS